MTNQEIMNLVNGSMFANLGFIDQDGKPAIRRVYCTWHKGLGAHLISTNTSSMHVKCLQERSDACLYFENSKRFEGVCFTGRAIVHFEPEYREMLWTPGDEKYYPKGVEDEDYCVLEFVAEKGRYYRFDGIGDLSQEKLAVFDEGAVWENRWESLV